MGQWKATVFLLACVGCATDAVDGEEGEGLAVTPHGARRPASFRFQPAESVPAHWRSTREGPAVHWRLPASGGHLRLPTSAEVSVRSAGKWARLTDREGRAWTFGPLWAQDARGRTVSSAFRAGAGSLDVVVGKGAGPILVDPVLRTAPFSASFAPDAIAGVGDLDGDGFADVAAGAVGGTTTTPGRVHVWPGAAAGPDPAVIVDPTPAAAGWQYGRALAGDGDLDGDGYDDLIVGGDHRAWVHYGAATGVGGRTTRLDDPTSRAGAFGFAVGIAGDVDGDGLDDLLVGDPGFDTSRGSMGLYLGDAGGVSTVAAQTLEGLTAGEWFGVDVDGAGDVHGDGFADVVVGAHAWSGITGRAYVFAGTTSGLATLPSTTLAGLDPLDNFGRAVDGAGDVNQDGYADVVIGAFNGALGYGQAAVYAGSSTGLSTVPTTLVQGPALGAKFGNAVAGLGDVDGDGYPDVGMGGHGTTTQAGVHHGSASGASTIPVPRLTGGVTLGKFLDAAGDVDGDGYADLLLADPGAGTVSVHFGGPDLDGDGWISPEDCDDGDSGVRGGMEVWTDRDGDGFGDPASAEITCVPGPDRVFRGGDCDDSNASVHPDAMEWVGDRLDSDCDGLERCFVDGDGDGALSDRAEVVEVEVAAGGLDCTSHGYLGADAVLGDCDDADPAVSPSASEVCSGTDTNCDGRVDEPVPEDAPLWWEDRDGDGFGSGAPTAACTAPEGMVTASTPEDCDDGNSEVNPDATDRPGDGVDSDCDGRDPAGGNRDSGAASTTGSSESRQPATGTKGRACSASGGERHRWIWCVLAFVAACRSRRPNR